MNTPFAHKKTQITFQELREKFLKSEEMALPGHYMPGMEGLIGKESEIIPPTDAIASAVTLLIHETAEGPSIIFIERSHRFGLVQHRGQIAFPGGKKETDESLKSCAFRETKEEIGVSLSENLPVKALSPLYIPVSNYLIQPYVAFQHQLPPLEPNPSEVEKIIISPLTDLDNRYPVFHKNIQAGNRYLENVPYFPLEGKVLWGATALIFSEFLSFIRK